MKWVVLGGALALLFAALLPASVSAATINVTTTNDDFNANPGTCSLREAVQSANTNTAFNGCEPGESGQPDTIVLDAAMYSLSLPVGDANDDDNNDGDLDVGIAGTGGLVIHGAGAGQTILTTSLSDRLIEQASGALTVSDLQITGGNAPVSEDGGGIRRVGGDLTIVRAGFFDNGAPGSGGAILFESNPGTLSISDSSFNGNFAQFSGGAIWFKPSSGTLSMTDSSVTSNSLSTSMNTVVAGAGIATAAQTTTISGSTISGNRVFSSDPLASAEGIGLQLFHSSLGSALIQASTISGNAVESGSSNISVSGAAIWNEMIGASVTTVLNSTIAANHANADPLKQNTGGLFDQDGAVHFIQSTLSGNTGATVNEIQRQVGEVVAGRGTLIGTGVNACGVLGVDGSPVASEGFNLERGTTCFTPPGPTDMQNTDPQLGALASNGGPTQTMALPSTSPAIDRIPVASCTDENGALLTADQRGQPRPGGSACDVGAYEFQPSAPESPPSSPFSSGSNTKCFGKKVTISGSGAADVLVGTSGNDVIAAMGGADKINAGAGNDTVCGGTGRDRLKGAAGNDTLLGQGGRDRLFGGGGKDLLNAGAGRRELCNGGGGRDTAQGCESKKGVP